jgi:DNA polymerase III alpha subunit
VRNVITSLSSWFGSGVYVEIQRHNVPDNEEELNSGFLHAIAQSCGVPVIITQDSHYVAYEDRKDHETLKTLMSWSDDVDDAVFPGDGYHMVDSEWMAGHHTPEVYAAGMEGLTDLLSKAKVSIPELDDFTLKVPDTSKSGNPDDELIIRSARALSDAIGKKFVSAKRRKEYEDRLEEELDVVIEAGFSGYLLFTALITERMRERGIIHAVRGSASGSLLCWLIGITEFDPIAWSLRFDRFLSRDRTKPPDIDIDIEHLRRDEVIAWLSDSYTTARISTWTKLSVNDDSD